MLIQEFINMSSFYSIRLKSKQVYQQHFQQRKWRRFAYANDGDKIYIVHASWFFYNVVNGNSSYIRVLRFTSLKVRQLQQVYDGSNTCSSMQL